MTNDNLVDHDEYEHLGTHEAAPYGHTTEYDYPVAVIGGDPGAWYFTPEKLREIADEVEEAFRYKNYCKAKREIDEEPLSKEEWRQMLDDIEGVNE